MKWILKIKNSIWIIPAMYCAIAAVLAFVIVYIDIEILPMMGFELPFFLSTNVDLAKEILGSISGALLTMTTITFSTIMVVLTTYASQFSPRVLTNFVKDRRTMRVLGVFMGGFLYSILSLAFMQRSTFDGEVISAIVAVMLAVLCLFFFAYFIHFIASSIQVINLIQTLVEDVKKEIDRKEKEFTQPHVSISRLNPELVVEYTNVTHLNSEEFGFIQFINHDKLFKWANSHDAVIQVEQMIGSFLTPSTHLLSIHHHEDVEVPDSLLECVEIGKERIVYQDTDYGLQKIGDVAMRALSPGINDPTTAVQCIYYLSEVLSQEFNYTGTHIMYADDQHLVRYIYQRSSVSDKLYTALSQISFYGRQDVVVLLTIFKTLENIAANSKGDVSSEIKTFSDYVYENFDQDVLHGIDYKYVNEMKKKLHEALN